MSRFLLTRDAQEDLEDIRAYHPNQPCESNREFREQSLTWPVIHTEA
jgi:plasmid stabilization system protein ParE